MGSRRHIAFFTDKLSTGGVGRVLVNLANELTSLGYRIDLIVSKKGGPYVESLDPSVNIFQTGTTNRIFALPRLAKYLLLHRPDAVITDRLRLNFAALDASSLTRSASKICLSVHVPLSMRLARLEPAKKRRAEKRIKAHIPKNFSVIAVSKGVAGDMAKELKIPAEKIKLVYNPIITEQLFKMAEEDVDHPWFRDKETPVVLAAGRLYPQKDFPTLIRAFKKLASRVHCRLMILGEGEQKGEIEALVQQNGLEQQVLLPGFVGNPYKYMARADLFVLSSRWEGFGNVLAEAMALGTPVVSTNCPYGPDEILEDGRLGPLARVGDPDSLSRAMEQALKAPLPSMLLQKGAERFTARVSAKGYLKAAGLEID